MYVVMCNIYCAHCIYYSHITYTHRHIEREGESGKNRESIPLRNNVRNQVHSCTPTEL